jgi:hypothetical protein
LPHHLAHPQVLFAEVQCVVHQVVVSSPR